jgi:hypothetical protein
MLRRCLEVTNIWKKWLPVLLSDMCRKSERLSVVSYRKISLDQVEQWVAARELV